MSTAITFDSAGTLLYTIRVAHNICTDTLLADVETTLLTYDDPDRVLCVLYMHIDQLMAASPSTSFATFMTQHNASFDISCSRRSLTKEEVKPIICGDTEATVGHAVACVRAIQNSGDGGNIMALNSGCIVNMNLGRIEFMVATGGVPFIGAKEVIATLMQHDVSVYIASGDKEDKLLRVATYLGVPMNHVCGVATPVMKASFVRSLRQKYDKVVMVGDGINDIYAFREADLAILTEQQGSCTIANLLEAVDVRIQNICDVPKHVLPDIPSSLLPTSRMKEPQ